MNFLKSIISTSEKVTFLKVHFLVMSHHRENALSKKCHLHIQFELENKSCLDLFAGTGGLGLEALSRGAQHVTFVEREKSLYKNIIKNISHLSYENKIQAACSDAFKWLKTNKQKFDIIFLDPPFDQIDYKILIRTIYQSNVLNEGGKVFLETNKHTELELSKTQNILKDKTIGDVRLMILE